MKKDLDKLKKRIGERIIYAELEFYKYEEDPPELISILIKFENGNPYYFGCAGSGGIFVRRKNKRDIEDKDCYIEPFHFLANKIFNDFKEKEDRMILELNCSELEIINCDDNLVIEEKT